MGSIYTPLVFTNTGTVTCTLDGHPGVSFIDDAGNQIGPVCRADARRDAHRRRGTRRAGSNATLQTHDAGLFDTCVPVPAHRMKVYPPDQTEAIVIAYDFVVCTGAIGDSQFIIDVVSPGTGP